MPDWIADRRLYLTGGGLADPNARVVEHNHPEAAWLLVAEGQMLASGYVQRFNLPASLYEEKQAEPTEDKMLGRPEDKSVAGPEVRRGPGRPRRNQ